MMPDVNAILSTVSTVAFNAGALGAAVMLWRIGRAILTRVSGLGDPDPEPSEFPIDEYTDGELDEFTTVDGKSLDLWDDDDLHHRQWDE